MKKSDFIRLQREDIKTLNNPVYDSVLQLFENYIPVGAEVKEGKTVVGMYDFMFLKAKEVYKKDSSKKIVCINPFTDFKEYMFEYLELKQVNEESFSLEDFFS